jgi:hypothetical protein
MELVGYYRVCVGACTPHSPQWRRLPPLFFFFRVGMLWGASGAAADAAGVYVGLVPVGRGWAVAVDRWVAVGRSATLGVVMGVVVGVGA